MALRRSFALLVLATFVCTAAASGQENDSQIVIPNWPAPLFWSPPAGTVPAEGNEVGGVRTLSLSPEAVTAVPTPPLRFIGITPCRIADTREASFPPGYGPPPLAAGAPRNFTLTGFLCSAA